MVKRTELGLQELFAFGRGGAMGVIWGWEKCLAAVFSGAEGLGMKV